VILVDTGPMVALFDRDDQYHALCLQTIEKFHELLITTWPVLTECFYLLGFSLEAQEDLWTFLKRGGMDIFQMDKIHFSQCRDLMRQFRNLPMDLADASLVVAADVLGVDRVFTLDHRDFSAYRFRRTGKFKLSPPKL
jgi:predicted nucleic acid-binding protein